MEGVRLPSRISINVIDSLTPENYDDKLQYHRSQGSIGQASRKNGDYTAVLQILFWLAMWEAFSAYL